MSRPVPPTAPPHELHQRVARRVSVKTLNRFLAVCDQIAQLRLSLVFVAPEASEPLVRHQLELLTFDVRAMADWQARISTEGIPFEQPAVADLLIAIIRHVGGLLTVVGGAGPLAVQKTTLVRGAWPVLVLRLDLDPGRAARVGLADQMPAVEALLGTMRDSVLDFLLRLARLLDDELTDEERADLRLEAEMDAQDAALCQGLLARVRGHLPPTWLQTVVATARALLEARLHLVWRISPEAMAAPEHAPARRVPQDFGNALAKLFTRAAVVSLPPERAEEAAAEALWMDLAALVGASGPLLAVEDLRDPVTVRGPWLVADGRRFAQLALERRDRAALLAEHELLAWKVRQHVALWLTAVVAELPDEVRAAFQREAAVSALAAVLRGEA